MIKKVLAGVVVFAGVSLFGMSLSQLNSASKSDLMAISGIGEAKADAILKERKHGKFKSFDDLTRVKGIGSAIAKRVKDDVKSAPKKKAKKAEHRVAKKATATAVKKSAVRKKVVVKKPTTPKVKKPTLPTAGK